MESDFVGVRNLSALMADDIASGDKREAAVRAGMTTQRKELIFDKRYGWVYEQWVDPWKVANAGGLGMFALLPLLNVTARGIYKLTSTGADALVSLVKEPPQLSRSELQHLLQGATQKYEKLRLRQPVQELKLFSHNKLRTLRLVSQTKLRTLRLVSQDKLQPLLTSASLNFKKLQSHPPVQALRHFSQKRLDAMPDATSFDFSRLRQIRVPIYPAFALKLRKITASSPPEIAPSGLKPPLPDISPRMLLPKFSLPQVPHLAGESTSSIDLPNASDLKDIVEKTRSRMESLFKRIKP